MFNDVKVWKQYRIYTYKAICWIKQLKGYLFYETQYINTPALPTSIKEITITKSILISTYTFLDCTSVLKITLPNDTKIDYYTHIPANAVVYYNGTETQWNAIEGHDNINNTIYFT